MESAQQDQLAPDRIVNHHLTARYQDCAENEAGSMASAVHSMLGRRNSRQTSKHGDSVRSVSCEEAELIVFSGTRGSPPALSLVRSSVSQYLVIEPMRS